MNLTLLSAYLFSVMALLLTPGPVVALITATAARHGYRRAFATAAGTNAASLLLIALATLILKGVVSLSAIWLNLLGLAGAAYIGYIAFSLLQNSGSGEASSDRPAPAGFIRGLITGVSNPKDILFFVSFFPQFIAVTHRFSTSIATLCAVWMVCDIAILTLYILSVRKWLTGKQGKKAEWVSALFLLLIACGGVVYNLYPLRGVWQTLIGSQI